ncbi:hypothetical protein [Pseudomonas syringae]|uniref:Uncharacterized protein n=3 Tax=Pseudomonas TaxID=286 RepID=A0A0P9N750_PSESX|nr:hypothetical protein [Pseudomonas syringae]RMS67902.1 hypothetical protein ALP61_02952 [Pseudomonas savastanoi]KPW98063.1 Uncharacterized protein ALO50_01927 [Pseudomonas syringae pv. cerasicola]KWS90126.1 hypothetical protein AL049_02500 [Pseudomonas syringae pv. cerasicola]PHN78516.1 hypothetical protein AO272_02420 [Pseudomonas syringae pv. cerasicola]PHN79662.1 hypothetical protein AO252_11780 [Pseudomonas syringae pv. cerasicola]
MNDPTLMLNKIEELLKASRQTDDLFHHAAVFGAVSSMVKQLSDFFEENADWAGENMEHLRWHSAAMLGYDITNGKEVEQHHVWTPGAIGGLRQALLRIER